MKINVQRLKEPEEYATRIKKFEEYFGYIAWAVIYLKGKGGREALGTRVLEELMDKYPNKPEAYLVLWSYYYENKNYDKAL